MCACLSDLYAQYQWILKTLPDLEDNFYLRSYLCIRYNLFANIKIINDKYKIKNIINKYIEKLFLKSISLKIVLNFVYTKK